MAIGLLRPAASRQTSGAFGRRVPPSLECRHRSAILVTGERFEKMRTPIILLTLLLVAPLNGEDKSSARASARVGVRILSLAELEPSPHIVSAMEARIIDDSLAGILVYE